jgi:hypothetical protein
MEISYQKSLEEAAKIIKIQPLVLELDVPYLSACLRAMKEDLRRKDSMSILNPRPLVHNSQQELSKAKANQLELYIALAENCQEIMKCESAHATALSTENTLSELFK